MNKVVVITTFSTIIELEEDEDSMRFLKEILDDPREYIGEDPFQALDSEHTKLETALAYRLVSHESNK